jgi:hypothetical protein
MITSFVDFGYFILGLYSLILILIGTPLNLLCFYIFKRLTPNRSNATIIAFSYLALIELLIPFTWNLNYIIRELFWKHQKTISIKNLEQYSLFVCKLISYCAYFLLQSAAWLKTLAAFARCVTVRHEWPIKKYFLKSSIIHGINWIIIFVIGLINLPVWIVNGKRHMIVDKYNNTQIQIKCYQSKLFQFWEIEHLLLYNFIPFTLMILFNILTIRHVHASRRRTQRSKVRSPSLIKHQSTVNRRSMSNNGSRLTRTLIFITIFFILFTSPSAIFYIFLGNIVKRHRNLITMGLSNLATTSHVSSFIIYWLTSTDFRDAAISLLCCRSLITQKQIIEDKQQEKRVSFQPSSTPAPIISSKSQPQSSFLQLSESIQ